MEPENKPQKLFRDDILRAKKAALNLKNADLLCEEVRSEATIGRTMKGENVDLTTLSAVARKLGVNMPDLFIFDDQSEQAISS